MISIVITGVHPYFFFPDPILVNFTCNFVKKIGIFATNFLYVCEKKYFFFREKDFFFVFFVKRKKKNAI